MRYMVCYRSFTYIKYVLSERLFEVVYGLMMYSEFSVVIARQHITAQHSTDQLKLLTL